VTVELPKTAVFCASPSEIVWALTGNQGVASSTETINVTAHAPSDLRAVWCTALLAHSGSLRGTGIPL